MAISPDKIDRLKAQLLISGLSQQNNSLFQVINQLIDALKEVISTSNTSGTDLTTIETQIAAIFAANFLMSIDESINFPNSRELLAGTNIDINNTIVNQSTISVESFDEADIEEALYPDFSFTGNPWCYKSPYDVCNPWEK